MRTGPHSTTARDGGSAENAGAFFGLHMGAPLLEWTGFEDITMPTTTRMPESRASGADVAKQRPEGVSISRPREMRITMTRRLAPAS